MIGIAKVMGRLLAFLIGKEIITKEESEYILEPLKEANNETDN